MKCFKEIDARATFQDWNPDDLIVDVAVGTSSEPEDDYNGERSNIIIIVTESGKLYASSPALFKIIPNRFRKQKVKDKDCFEIILNIDPNKTSYLAK